MRQRKFFNNATFSLVGVLPSDPQTATVEVDRSPADAGIDLPFDDSGLDEGFFTVATLSHPALPGLMEIVNILSYVDNAGYYVTMERAREGTSALAWPADTIAQCRVTAGTLRSLDMRAAYSRELNTLSLNFGDNDIDWTDQGERLPTPGTWAIGGVPAAPAVGFADARGGRMCMSVEGVGYTSIVELGTAPNYNPASQYYPGQLAKDPNSPFYTYALGRGAAFTTPQPALGDWPWVRFAPETDGNIVAFPRFDENHDLWFYPVEIGFICERYTASGVPAVTIEDLDFVGSTVSTLVSAKSLTGLTGAQQRIVIANDITKGVKGFHFVRATAAAGGSCQGRFYWRGMFILSPTNTGYPSSLGNTDGSTV